MDSVLRVLAIYAFLVVVFRLAGSRTLSEMTTFDLLLLLIISETTSQFLVGQDASMTNAFLLILTFVTADIGLSLLMQRSRAANRMIDGAPVIIVDRGRPLKDRMARARVDEQDILESARIAHGLARMDQVRYAVLERSGKISVIPAATAWGTGGPS